MHSIDIPRNFIGLVEIRLIFEKRARRENGECECEARKGRLKYGKKKTPTKLYERKEIQKE